jgi:hypothetical protein
VRCCFSPKGSPSCLFAPDVVLPRLSPGFSAAALWVGQLLGAAWLGLSAFNWIHRRAVLGGVYERPVVCANLIQYFIGAIVLVRAAQRASSSSSTVPLWLMAVPAAALALAYGVLLFRGPFDAPR